MFLPPGLSVLLYCCTVVTRRPLPYPSLRLYPHDVKARLHCPASIMIASTRRWFRRNRANFVLGAGVLGAGYLAGQYVLGKVSEARQRMSDDRIAKEKYAPFASDSIAIYPS